MITALRYLVLAVLAAVPLRAQLLWPNTMAGMSVEQVQREVPEARAPSGDGAVLPSGRGVELLAVDAYEIAGRNFHVQFFFREQRLVRVTLTDSGVISVKEFERLRDLLRGQYGQENSTRSSEFIEVTWKAVQTTIKLEWIPGHRDQATLAISYDAPIPKQTPRL